MITKGFVSDFGDIIELIFAQVLFINLMISRFLEKLERSWPSLRVAMSILRHSVASITFIIDNETLQLICIEWHVSSFQFNFVSATLLCQLDAPTSHISDVHNYRVQTSTLSQVSDNLRDFSNEAYKTWNEVIFAIIDKHFSWYRKPF